MTTKVSTDELLRRIGKMMEEINRIQRPSQPYGTMMQSKAGTKGMVVSSHSVYCFGCKHVEPAEIEGWRPLESEA